VVGTQIAELAHTYTWRDVVIYALGVGAKADELDFLYEAEGPKVLPTFAAVGSFKLLASAAAKLKTDLLRVVHGEQTIRLHRPIPPSGTLVTTGTITAIHDKGSGALVVVEGKALDPQTGAHVFDTVFSIFVRGAGGFGGTRGPKSAPPSIPDAPATFEMVERTSNEQHLLYRLNGDVNPIHVSPKLAKVAGFDRPILHGLCTYGHAGRAIVKHACGGDPSRLRSFTARFTGVVFPGDTLTTRGWRIDDTHYLIRVVTQTGATVIDHSIAEIGAM
jgi:acyl dehydratase